MCSIGGSGTSAIFVAHGSVVECYGEDVEGGSYDREEPGTNVERGFGYMHAGYLECGRDSSGNEGGGDEVLR